MPIKKLAKHRAVIIPGLILSLALAPLPSLCRLRWASVPSKSRNALTR